MKKRIKALSALSGALCVFAASVFVYALPAYAYQAKNGKSDTIYKVLDNAEVKDKNFSITYNIEGNQSFKRIVWAEYNLNGWDAYMDAEAGEQIRITYSISYPENSKNTTYYDKDVWLDAKSVNYTNGGAGTEETKLFEIRKPMSSGVSDTLVIDIPKDSDKVYCTIYPSYEFHNYIEGTDVDSTGENMFSLSIKIEVHNSDPSEVKVTKKAKETTGEDEGVSVPAAIVLGTLATGAAVGGAAAAAAAAGAGGGAGGGGAANSGDHSGKQRQSSYKMYVQKDFSNAIRKGAEKPSVIRVRMAEITPEGIERDRNDLTAQISISSDSLTVHNAVLAGRYCEVTVSAPADSPASEAGITFTFTGKGGTLSNTVVFRLVDAPRLQFAEEYPEGSGQLRLYDENCGIYAIHGDGFTYKNLFTVTDATVPVSLTDFSADDTPDFRISFEATKWQNVFLLIIQNLTKPEKNEDVFAKPLEKQIEIKVRIKDEKEPVTGYATVYLYPEGITVQSRDEGKKNGVKYVRVQSYEKEYAGDLDKKWQVSEIKFTLAVKGEDKALIDPEGMKFTFDRLKGSGGRGTSADKEQAIADKYEYEEASGMYNGKFTYNFEPHSDLWEPDNGTFFLLNLPVTCEYRGEIFKADIPLRMRGKDPDPMQEWNKEYEKTRERIEKFSLPENKAHHLQQLEAIAAKEPRISTWELRLMAKDIVRSYMNYWTQEHDKHQWHADVLDWTVWGLDWVKWIGDCAFSYVAAAYTGPMEAIISPAKDVLVSALGEVGVNIVWGTKFNVENLEIVAALKTAGDNFVSTWAATGAANVLKANPMKIKQAAAIMGAYFAYACLNNYLEHMAKTGESDFYGAIMGAFKDLTVTAIKAAASALFGKWLESEKFKKEIGPQLSKFMQKYFGEHCRINLTDQVFSHRIEATAGSSRYWMDIDAEILKSGIVEKYFTELCGLGAATIHDNIEKAEKVLFWVSPHGELMFSFCINLLAGNVDTEPLLHLCDISLSSVIMKQSGALFSWMYNLFFGGLPVAQIIMPIPKDPPLPSSR
ncbi:MAG: hypothetical protein IKI58_09135 [Oscillospiraceae bacterium]|nr:hypothetical protein [Oscillospiraceae bacterium]